MTHVKYTHRQAVQVRNSAGLQWMNGTIDKLEGRGAVVLIEGSGKRNFYYWGSIRPRVEVETRRPSSGTTRVDPEDQFTPPRPQLPRKPEAPRATLGDVMPASLKAAAAGVHAGATAPALPVPTVIPGPAPHPGNLRLVNGPSDADSMPRKLPPGFGEAGKPRIMKPRARERPRTPTAIGDAMKAIRIEKGYTQNDLADKMPCPRGRLVNVEAGDALPDNVEVERFSAALGFAPDELLKLLEHSRLKRTEERAAARELAANPEPKSKKPKRKVKTKAERHAREQELKEIGDRLDEELKEVAAKESSALPPPGISHIKMKLPGGIEVEGVSVEEAARLLQMMKKD